MILCRHVALRRARYDQETEVETFHKAQLVKKVTRTLELEKAAQKVEMQARAASKQRRAAKGKQPAE
jgi:hypothetical protein